MSYLVDVKIQVIDAVPLSHEIQHEQSFQGSWDKKAVETAVSGQNRTISHTSAKAQT